MQLVRRDVIISAGPWAESEEWQVIDREITHSIGTLVWPPGNSRFVLNPSTGRGRGEGNGVVPIKEGFLLALRGHGWETDERRNPLRFDAVKTLATGNIFGLEWETGNVSSSHRSINRILLAHQRGLALGGALVLPTRRMYQYLTDRIGNVEELEPYYPVWQAYPWEDGVLAMYGVEHDDTSELVPRIEKGTDGRALI